MIRWNFHRRQLESARVCLNFLSPSHATANTKSKWIIFPSTSRFDELLIHLQHYLLSLHGGWEAKKQTRRVGENVSLCGLTGEVKSRRFHFALIRAAGVIVSLRSIQTTAQIDSILKTPRGKHSA
jgi:hypothetical protein